MKAHKILIIHPKDHTTDFLCEAYKGMGCTVIRGNVSRSLLLKQIRVHSRIVIMGHGSEHGLFGHKRLVICSRMVQELRLKEVFAIWCNADQFMTKYGVTGMYTGMIISEMEEALQYCVPATPADIEYSNKLLASTLRSCILVDDAIAAHAILTAGYQPSDIPVMQFNAGNLYCSSPVTETVIV